MATKHHILTSVLSLALLASCASDAIGGGVAGTAVSQGRSIKETSDDLLIKTHIKTELAQHKMFSLVGVKVSEGRVLLTGKVSSQLDRLEAYKIAWLEPGVREVDNDIIVTGSTKKSLESLTVDSLITSEIKSKLLVTEHIRSINYGFETIDGVVYILGIAQSQHEFDEVLGIVKHVKGVKKVKSYVRIK